MAAFFFFYFNLNSLFHLHLLVLDPSDPERLGEGMKGKGLHFLFLLFYPPKKCEAGARNLEF